MSIKNTCFIGGVALLLIAGGWALWRNMFAYRASVEADSEVKEPKLIAQVAPTYAAARHEQAEKAGRKKSSKRDGLRHRRRSTPVVPYSKADKKLVDAVQEALDNESYLDVVKSVEAAMKSSNPDVRNEAVDALGWFGEPAMVQLTKAMLDKDESVAENARGQVEMTLMGLEDSNSAFDYAASYISTFNGDAEAVCMFEGVLTTSANEIVEPDDLDSEESVQKAKDNRRKIVETLMMMMGEGERLDVSARSAYEEITGNEWTTAAEAERWINDLKMPEEEVDEDSEGDSDDELDAALED